MQPFGLTYHAPAAASLRKGICREHAGNARALAGRPDGLCWCAAGMVEAATEVPRNSGQPGVGLM